MRPKFELKIFGLFLKRINVVNVINFISDNNYQWAVNNTTIDSN